MSELSFLNTDTDPPPIIQVSDMIFILTAHVTELFHGKKIYVYA
jgi:hypothetical protein